MFLHICYHGDEMKQQAVDLIFESTDAGNFGVASLTKLTDALLADNYMTNGDILSPQQARTFAETAYEKGLNFIIV